MKRMDGRIAVVTGASSGIGRAAAVQLVREGASVALLALDDGSLTDAVEACTADSAGGSVIAVPVDVSDSERVRSAFETVETTLGPIDAVFNNAGISVVAPVHETTDAQWHRQVAVNLSGSFFVQREAIRLFRPRRRGAIVNTGSELAIIGQGGYSGYSATKGGVLAMTRALAAEVAKLGIRINAVCPGAIDTPLLMAEFALSADPMQERSDNEQSIALGRIGLPEEIAAAVVFLLSDEASYITGTQLMVDGGRVSCFPVGSIATDPTAFD